MSNTKGEVTIMKTKKLIRIPVGEKLLSAPINTHRAGEHYQIIVGLGDDAAGFFTFCDDGLKYLQENGFVTPPKETN